MTLSSTKEEGPEKRADTQLENCDEIFQDLSAEEERRGVDISYRSALDNTKGLYFQTMQK